MKNTKLLLIYIFLFMYILINNLIVNTPLSKYNNLFITPILLISIAVLSYIVLKKREKKSRYKFEKIQNIIIILFIYSIIYFLSGLIFRYEPSIYGRDFLTIIKNIYSFAVVIISTEYIRNRVIVSSEDNIINNVFISLIFAFITTNFTSMLNNLTPFSLGFKYIAIILLPEIVTSFVLTYLSKSVGLSSTLIYKLWLRMIMILLPIIPSLPWIITAIINLLLPMIVYFNINHFNTLYDRRERRFREEKYSKSTYILSIITALLILFTLKVFNYFPVAVLSESMNPIFSKGDVIVIEKVNESILDSLKEYDIIYYKKDNKYIIHRIYKIEEKNGKRVITTKGDNNNDIDTWKVYDEEIVGVMKLKFPYIGYPTVWFNELLNN